MNHIFYKSTPLHKELLVLDLIEKNENITQRQMSDVLGSSVAMTNNYLQEMEDKGLLKREYISSKEVLYLITNKGRERRKYLSVIYLSESQKMYDNAKEELLKFVKSIKEKGFNKILLYGAGEVAEIFLNTIKDEIEVLAVIDDDPNKQGERLVNTLVIPRSEIVKYHYDAILISSLIHQDEIIRKLKATDLNRVKIITFLNMKTI